MAMKIRLFQLRTLIREELHRLSEGPGADQWVNPKSPAPVAAREKLITLLVGYANGGGAPSIDTVKDLVGQAGLGQWMTSVESDARSGQLWRLVGTLFFDGARWKEKPPPQEEVRAALQQYPRLLAPVPR